MKKIIYIDIDDTLADWSSAMEKTKKLNPTMSFPQAEYGFYSGLIPIEGSIDAVKWLLNSTFFDPFILTAPSVMNPMSYTEKRVWVERYLGMEMVEKLIISPNKSLLKGDYLIDDNTSGRGQEGFEGSIIQFGSTDFPHWQSVIDKLKTLSNGNKRNGE